MTSNEANRIINEYMGTDEANTGCNFKSPIIKRYIDKINNKYHLSLDALVPVWEKLNIDHFECYPKLIRGGRVVSKFGVREVVRDWDWKYGHGNTIQEAAAIATAKAIQELKE